MCTMTVSSLSLLFTGRQLRELSAKTNKQTKNQTKTTNKQQKNPKQIPHLPPPQLETNK